jgi:hypothetical protein
MSASCSVAYFDAFVKLRNMTDSCGDTNLSVVVELRVLKCTPRTKELWLKLLECKRRYTRSIAALVPRSL